MTIPKSDLDYLLEALRDPDHTSPYWFVSLCTRAIELRKQDLAKEVIQDDSTDRYGAINAQPGAAHPADNTPKGGGDVTRYGVESKLYEIDPQEEAQPSLQYVTADSYDALLAERDAARAELKEAAKTLQAIRNVMMPGHSIAREQVKYCVQWIDNFLNRVGKQP